MRSHTSKTGLEPDAHHQSWLQPAQESLQHTRGAGGGYGNGPGEATGCALGSCSTTPPAPWHTFSHLRLSRSTGTPGRYISDNHSHRSLPMWDLTVTSGVIHNSRKRKTGNYLGAANTSQESQSPRHWCKLSGPHQVPTLTCPHVSFNSEPPLP